MATIPVQSPEAIPSEGWEEFQLLESRIQRVAEALQQARAERDKALAVLAPLQAAHEKLQHAHAQSEHELVALRKERNEVRQRIARLGRQLEAAEG